MNLRLFAAVALAGTSLAGCATMADTRIAAPEATGYFAQPSTLHLNAPDFRAISDADFRPAFEQAIAIERAEVAAIAGSRDAPTFENTIAALEQSGKMRKRVAAVFNALKGANTNPTLDAIDAEVAPKLAASEDTTNLDLALFRRVKAVYDNRAAMNMTPEDARLLERTYERMVHAGVMLTDAQKEQVKAINAQLSTATTEFGQRLTRATKNGALVVSDKVKLEGLSPAGIDAAAKAAVDRGAPGSYAIALQNTTQQPALGSLSHRPTREALYEKSWNRAERGDANDTRTLLAEIVKLRAQKAALFGNPDWATYQMWDRMAKDPRTALSFMEQMVPALAATQRADAAMLNAEIKASGGDFTVKPWDWQMYADRVKAKKFDLDEEAMKPYFEVRRVLEDGVFFAASQLYGLSFKPRPDIPVYHPDVWAYDVFDKDGSQLGLFYFDPFQRDNKRGGAWKGNFVDQTRRDGTKPVIYNVLNIPKAPEGQPQLVSFDNVETMFHEFGHALHGFFADQEYASLSGTATARDFVEYPSQVNELWASYPAVLANYAKHYQTAAPIPQALIEKMQAAEKFDQGYGFGEVVEAALLDMKWHALTPGEAAAIDTPAKVNAFEAQALSELGLAVDLVPPRYRSSYFRHIFSDPAGYSAGYYSYLWTEMLDRDSRKWFLDNGGLTRANGDHFRKTVLSRGGTMDYFEMFRNFAGRAPDVRPMLEARGLTGANVPADGGGASN
ncbi:M3 family metallopeptidase [Tsuneonella sp. HG249]